MIKKALGGKSIKKDRGLLNYGGSIVAFGAADRLSTRLGIIGLLRFAIGFGWYNPIGLLMKSQSIIGVNMLAIADHKPELLQECLQNVVALNEQGILKPHAGGSFPIEELAIAHDLLENRKTKGKLVVNW